MGRNELAQAMLDDRYRFLNARGWPTMTAALRNMSDESFQKMLDWGPDRFAMIVRDDDLNMALMFNRGFNRLSEENVDEFLRLQRVHAAVTPLYSGTVAQTLLAWFNSCVGSELATP